MWEQLDDMRRKLGRRGQLLNLKQNSFVSIHIRVSGTKHEFILQLGHTKIYLKTIVEIKVGSSKSEFQDFWKIVRFVLARWRRCNEYGETKTYHHLMPGVHKKVSAQKLLP